MYYARTTKRKEIAKNLAKNDELWINHYTLFVVSPDFDEILPPHEIFLWCFVKKLLSREISNEMWNVKKTFSTNYVLYII